MAFLCKAIGCQYDGQCACRRCGVDLYDGFIPREGSWFAWWFGIYWWFHLNQWKIAHKCEVCGRYMLWSEDHCCSPTCYDQWCPF